MLNQIWFEKFVRLTLIFLKKLMYCSLSDPFFFDCLLPWPFFDKINPVNIQWRLEKSRKIIKGYDHFGSTYLFCVKLLALFLAISSWILVSMCSIFFMIISGSRPSWKYVLNLFYSSSLFSSYLNHSSSTFSSLARLSLFMLLS